MSPVAQSAGPVASTTQRSPMDDTTLMNGKLPSDSPAAAFVLRGPVGYTHVLSVISCCGRCLKSRQFFLLSFIHFVSVASTTFILLRRHCCSLSPRLRCSSFPLAKLEPDEVVACSCVQHFPWDPCPGIAVPCTFFTFLFQAYIFMLAFEAVRLPLWARPAACFRSQTFIPAI